eukprot:gene50082-68039_t
MSLVVNPISSVIATPAVSDVVLQPGGAGQQVVVQTMRDGGKATHGTGGDDHARNRIGPRGDAVPQITDAVQPGGQRGKLCLRVRSDFQI